MKEKKTIVTRDIISRIETLHSEIQNVGRRLNDLDDEDENNFLCELCILNVNFSIFFQIVTKAT